MDGTIVSDGAIPAKLIIGDKEINVTLVGHSYKEITNDDSHSSTRVTGIRVIFITEVD